MPLITLPSKRELEILRLISFEHTSDEIASMLYISKETVNTHRKNMMKKLQAKNAAGLIRRAYELRLLKMQSAS